MGRKSTEASRAQDPKRTSDTTRGRDIAKMLLERFAAEYAQGDDATKAELDALVEARQGASHGQDAEDYLENLFSDDYQEWDRIVRYGADFCWGALTPPADGIYYIGLEKDEDTGEIVASYLYTDRDGYPDWDYF
ncbi:hypothetical protein [Timonella sp. A28]|uniref:hypothetical protein n=1 Tax=Timonella sp. A28 TaxID=3442640 RepID=UPI003EBE85BE